MKALLILASLLTAGSAHAAYYSRSHSCADVRAAVNAHGAMIIYTSGSTYDRYVSGQGYCYDPYVTRAAWVPTRDRANCFVGYTCEMRNWP